MSGWGKLTALEVPTELAMEGLAMGLCEWVDEYLVLTELGNRVVLEYLEREAAA